MGGTRECYPGSEQQFENRTGEMHRAEGCPALDSRGLTSPTRGWPQSDERLSLPPPSSPLRLVRLFFGALLLPLAHAQSQQTTSERRPPSDLAQAMQSAAGEWDWSGDTLTCRRNPHTVSFSRDSAFMIIRPREKYDSTSAAEYRYRILRFTEHTITGEIEGEQRRTASGKPVVWDLVLTGPNSYRWRRADGPPQGVTRAIVRCRDGQPLSEAQ